MNKLFNFISLLFLTILIPSTITAQEQKISVDFKNIELRQAIAQLESKSGYFFLYNSALISPKMSINVTKTNSTLNEILSEMFKGTDILYSLIDNQIVLSLPSVQGRGQGERDIVASQLLVSADPNVSVSVSRSSQNQRLIVKGKVISSDDGLPLQYATVMLKGTNTYSVTDQNGNYSITVDGPQSVITYSFLGYTTIEETVGNRDVINISLIPETNILQDVVVTALGISREKKALGYAMQEVKGEEMIKTRQSNAIGMLSGKVAGLQITSAGGAIGGSSRVTLRGVKSVLGNNQPLYIIDGTPIDNADANTESTSKGQAGKDFGNMAQDINPDDIESISILKGASASALYGSRANNGVILITTKKGAKNKGVEVSLSTGFSMENMIERNLPVMQKLYGGGGGNVSDFTQVNINGRNYSVPAYDIDESWGPKLNGQMVLQWEALYPEETGNYLKETPWVYPKNDIMYYFKTGMVFDNNISISGGGENTTFRASYTNKSAKGIIPNSELSRNTLNTTGTINYGKLVISASLNYVNNSVLGRPWTGTTNRNVINQAYQWGMVQVDYKNMENYKRPNGSQRLWNVTAWDNLTPRYIDNPYWAAYMSYSEEERERMYGSVSINYQINDWLSAIAKTTGDTYTYGTEDRIAMYSRSMSEYSESITRFKEMNYEAMLTADKRFDNISLTAFVGGSMMTQDRRINTALTQGGLIIPEYYNLSNASSVTPTDRTFKKTIRSIFGSVSLGWRSLVFLDATFREDWSSTLPKPHNYFYPSVTSSFVFSDLPALRSQKWLTFGKLRLGWAEVGNDTDPYVLEKAYISTRNSFGGIPNYELASYLNNADLKPERTNSWEFGLDLRMFNSRLGIDFTFYDNLTKNQIIPLDISAASGWISKWMNAGSVINRGVELSLTGVPVRTGNFEWNAMVNWSKNKNEVKELYGGINSLRIASSFVDLYAVVGQPYGMIYGSNYVYDNDGNKVVDAAGAYVKTEQSEFLGSVLPDWIMGISNNFTYKNFSLGFLVDIRKGGKFFSQTYKTGIYSGTLHETAANGIRENGIVQEGVQGNVTFNPDGTYVVTNTSPNTVNIPAWNWARSVYNGATAQNLFDSDFVKLREVTLGYNFNTSQWQFIKGLRVSAFAYNVWTIYKSNKHIDPDFTTSSGNIQGIEGAVVPAPITYGVSLNLKF